jgi:hypothetical protein
MQKPGRLLGHGHMPIGLGHIINYGKNKNFLLF